MNRKILVILSILFFQTMFLKGVDQAPENKLSNILEGTAQYCEKLKRSVFHFVCLERVKENITRKLTYPKGASMAFDWGRGVYYDTIFKKGKSKERYTYDYRILKIKDDIKERKILIRKNGKKVYEKNPKKKTAVYSYKSAMTPVYMFARENQGDYYYRLVGEKRVMKRPAYEVSVFFKKSGKVHNMAAMVWVDKEDYSILKYKAYFGDFSADDLAGGHVHNIEDIKVNDVHYFGFMRDEIRFPTKTEIEVTYKGGRLKRDGKILLFPIGSRRLTRFKTVFKYEKYMFFKVKVGEEVFK